VAALEELSAPQIDEVVAAAVQRHVPVMVTVLRDDRWQMTAGRASALRGLHLLLELLDGAEKAGDGGDAKFAAAEKVGVSFKLRHHKYLFTATVVGVDREPASNVLAVCRPNRMQRLRRRAYARAVVPVNRIVRASFWLGGQLAEPTGASPTTPVWSGRVMNLSAGGFQLLVDAAATENVEDGNTVGVRIVFGVGEQAVYADAELRHIQPLGPKVMMGFRFVGLDQTNAGRQALKQIIAKVTEYERLAEEMHKPLPEESIQAMAAAAGSSPQED
jgi:c-di-GMP-binding flagellar brake protein YcgR